MSREPDPAELAELLSPAELPRVAEFLAGYLHEDWAIDYESPSEAIYEYLAEADPNDVEELATEWTVVAQAAHRLGLDELNRALTGRFRCGWRALSIAEVDGVTRELENAIRD
jgi:hypothetical protein